MSHLAGRRLAMYVGLCAVWGSTWLAIKIGLRDLPPLLFAGVRMGLACLLLTPFAFRRGGPGPDRVERGWIAWSGVLQIGVSYACIFLAEERIASGLAALLFATFPIFVGLFAHYLLPAEPLTSRT
ncbi:MAG TPA: EamA family transporter, partial [Thermoanaerobaculia bacterium]